MLIIYDSLCVWFSNFTLFGDFYVGKTGVIPSFAFICSAQVPLRAASQVLSLQGIHLALTAHLCISWRDAALRTWKTSCPIFYYYYSWKAMGGLCISRVVLTSEELGRWRNTFEEWFGMIASGRARAKKVYYCFDQYCVAIAVSLFCSSSSFEAMTTVLLLELSRG